MSEFRHSTPNLPKREEQIDNSTIRKSIRPASQVMADAMKTQGFVRSVLLGSAATMVVLPAGWVVVVPVSLAYYVWASSSRFKLPFRVPAFWGGDDYSEPKPGSKNKYTTSDGILYLGVDQVSGEELWITNSDARRHGFILGTTGSGKAFPVDTPVLTRAGWVAIGDLRPGEKIVHPDGGESSVASVHPQGKVQSVRMWFDDGRMMTCSPDHLWTVDILSSVPGVENERRTMLARDIGIMVNAYNGRDGMGRVDMRLPDMVAPSFSGQFDPDMEGAAKRAVRDGFDSLGFRPSLRGTAEQRRRFLSEWFREAERSVTVSAQEDTGAWKVSGLRAQDARELKRVIWSIGGRAATWRPNSVTSPRRSLVSRLARAAGKQISRACSRKEGLLSLTFRFPGMREAFGLDLPCDETPAPLRIVGVEAMDNREEMVCIKTDRNDGLYVVDGYLVTHNTELLLGIISQAIMWSSGFLFIDGKGTAPFYMRVWGLARRFGREDDVRVMNFTDSGGGTDPVPGGPGIQSNTSNPFAKGDSDQLMNILVSIMGDAGKGNDMWQQRATSLVTAAMKVLVEMRDKGEIQFNVQVLREYLALGKGISEYLAPGSGGGGAAAGARQASYGGAAKAQPVTVESIGEEAWAELRTRPGMIELYLRSLNGEFSGAATKALAGFFSSLPGFNLDLALKGKAQQDKANEQYNFLFMQLTKPLSTFADSYPHIFMTSFGEVDLEDVMLNRRILIVLLPALQKAKTEMQNCGKVVVALVKIMMGKAAGAKLAGSKKENLDSSPTLSVSPFIVVLDEVGYYMVDGIDVMMAQARGLGFMIILAGQDIAAMQAVSKELSEIAAANASTFASGKCVDGGRTIEFIDKTFGKVKISVFRGYERIQGDFGMRTVNSKDISFEEVPAVSFKELNGLNPGEFYYKFDREIAKTATFYIGEDHPDVFSVNKFLRIMGPMDKMPGIDQGEDMRFFGQLSDFCRRFIGAEARALPPASDMLTYSMDITDKVLSGLSEKMRRAPQNVLKATISGMLAAGTTIGHIDPGMSEPDSFDLDDDEVLRDFDYEAASEAGSLRSDSRARGRGMIDMLIAERDAARKAGLMKSGAPRQISALSAIDSIAMSQEAFRSLLSGNDGNKIAVDAVSALHERAVVSPGVPADVVADRGGAAMGALEAMISRKGSN